MVNSVGPGAQPNPGTIVITHRTDISLLYRILRIVIRPLRPRLVSPKVEYQAGSPRLRKYPRRINQVTITEREVSISSVTTLGAEAISEPNTEFLWVYDFHSPRSESDNVQATYTIYYFPGGGFQAPTSPEHWKFCAHLALSLSQSHVVLVSYPLAPHSPAKTTLPLLRRWLREELRNAVTDDKAISLVGDSSGAHIALSLGLWCADQLAVAKSSSNPGRDYGHYHRLKSVLAISPPTDLRTSNSNSIPKIDADARDPVLGLRIAERAATAWTADLESERIDPHISPKLADLANLRASGMGLNGVIGTADVLAPDAVEFMKRCGREGVKGQWLVWDGLMHCFPLAACCGLREGTEGRDWIVRVLEDVIR